MIFPVMGPSHFTDDWGVTRPDGRTHQGTDVFAAEGTPVVAADDGVMIQGFGQLGGNWLSITTPDTTRYYYAHLSSYAGRPRRVRAGELVGYVGRTGNASSTSPHLHFEVHPGGGAAVDPYPKLLAATRLDAPNRGNGAENVAGVLVALGLGLGIALSGRRRVV